MINLKDNKNNVVLALALLASLPAAAQEAINPQFLPPNLYGKLQLAVEHQREGGNSSRWDVANHASRLGLKGKVLLENDLAVIYQYEVGINPTDKDDPTFSQRNSYLGLSSAYGQIIAGVFDTPFKTAQGKVDLFNDTGLDITSYLAGEVRHEDSVQYTSPRLPGDVVATLAWTQGQQQDQVNGWAGSLALERDNYSVILALANKVAGDGGVVTVKQNPLNAARLMVSVTPIEAVRLGFLVQQAQGTGNDESREQGWMASIAWDVERLTFKGQVGQGLADRDVSGANSKAKSSQLALGADYALAKNIKLISYAGMQRNKDGAAGTTQGESRNDHFVGVGMSLVF